MSRIYSATFTGVAVTVAQDLFDIAPADDKIVIIHGIYLSQTTELAEAAEEQLLVRLIRGFATVGSGGGAFTPVMFNEHQGAAASTVRINDTTIAVVGAGATDVIWSESYNIRSGWQFLPPPEMRPVVKQTSTRLVVQLTNAPADSTTMNGTMIWEEC